MTDDTRREWWYEDAEYERRVAERADAADDEVAYLKQRDEEADAAYEAWLARQGDDWEPELDGRYGETTGGYEEGALP